MNILNDFFQQFSDVPWSQYLSVAAVAAVVLFGRYGILTVRDMLSRREADEDPDYDLNFYRPEEEPVETADSNVIPFFTRSAASD